MSEAAKMQWQLDEQVIRQRRCAICDAARLRIVTSDKRPDFVICDGCHSAFVLEANQTGRVLYGKITSDLPQTRASTLKQWRHYHEVQAQARQERQIKGQVSSASEPPDDKPSPAPETSPASPPRPLRQTGELPNIDHLFE